MLFVVWIFEMFGFYGFVLWVLSLLKSNGVFMENILWYNVLYFVGVLFGVLFGLMIFEIF